MIKLLVQKRDGSRSVIWSQDYNKLRNVMNARLQSGEIVDYEVIL